MYKMHWLCASFERQAFSLIQTESRSSELMLKKYYVFVCRCLHVICVLENWLQCDVVAR